VSLWVEKKTHSFTSECYTDFSWGLLFFFSNRSETLPVSTTKNITCFGVSPDGNLAILVDEGIGKFTILHGYFFMSCTACVQNLFRTCSKKSFLKTIPNQISFWEISLKVMNKEIVLHKMLMKCNIDDSAPFLCQ